MNMWTIRIRLGGLMLAGTLLSAGCDLDLTDPNNPNRGDIVTSVSGLRELAIGLQATWGNELVAPVYIAGLATDELGAIVPAFESYRRVDAGDPVDNDVGPSTETWSGMYRVVAVADELLASVPQVPMEPELASGVIALARLFKAMAYGSLLQTYERIPLDVGLHNLHPEFATREQGLARVLELLESARQQITTTPPSATFNNQVLAPGFNLPNTIDAMIARYALIAGDLARADAAARRVNLSVLSEFRFSAADANPVWNMFYGSGNAFALRAKQRFRLQAQPGDRRVEYWVAAATIAGATGTLDNIVRYQARDRSFPVYLPDEMRLIRAEVHARRGELLQALVLLNEVRTQCSSPLNEPTACLPPLTLADVPTQQAMLQQILRERQYELYLQGLRWSDLRRFNQPLKYRFMMVPRTECDRNRSAPAELCASQTPRAS
jgi:starch-binding outer membrane protein, SusD/RagB family